MVVETDDGLRRHRFQGLGPVVFLQRWLNHDAVARGLSMRWLADLGSATAHDCEDSSATQHVGGKLQIWKICIFFVYFYMFLCIFLVMVGQKIQAEN